MFRRRDPVARDLQATFGVKAARLYDQPGDTDAKVALQSALAMTRVPGVDGPLMAHLIGDEIYSLVTGEIEQMPSVLSTDREGEYLRVMLGAALQSERRWALSGAQLDELTARLNLVPGGWRLDAMTGLRYWMASLVALPAPVRAVAAELHAVSSAFAWRAAVRMERFLDRPMPGLPYAAQAVALEALVDGLPARLTASWARGGVNAALDGYVNGLAIGMWDAITRGSGPLTDELVLRAAGHGVIGLRPVGTEIPQAVETRLRLEEELEGLRVTVRDVGASHATQVIEEGIDALLARHEYVMSRLFTI